MCGLDGHDLCIGRNTDDTKTVITLGRDDTRHVCAVAIIILRVTVMVVGASHYISTINVVYEAVIVFIDAVVWNLARVNPHVTCKVLVGVVDT